MTDRLADEGVASGAMMSAGVIFLIKPGESLCQSPNAFAPVKSSCAPAFDPTVTKVLRLKARVNALDECFFVNLIILGLSMWKKSMGSIKPCNLGLILFRNGFEDGTHGLTCRPVILGVGTHLLQ